jgi:hypothetical protein
LEGCSWYLSVDEKHESIAAPLNIEYWEDMVFNVLKLEDD